MNGATADSNDGRSSLWREKRIGAAPEQIGRGNQIDACGQVIWRLWRDGIAGRERGEQIGVIAELAFFALKSKTVCRGGVVTALPHVHPGVNGLGSKMTARRHPHIVREGHHEGACDKQGRDQASYLGASLQGNDMAGYPKSYGPTGQSSGRTLARAQRIIGKPPI